MFVDFEALTTCDEISKVPLPTFDPTVTNCLMNAKANKVSNRMVSQSAYYYHGKGPKIGEQHAYKIIGQKMIAAYPCIQQAGYQPWVYLIIQMIFIRDLRGISLIYAFSKLYI